MPTYKLTIEYDGTRYSGWQAQANTARTVQGKLIGAAREIFGEVDLGGAGRTDAGVHAAGQVAHLRVGEPTGERELARKLNDLLPHDIHILDAVRTTDRFHARHDAESRIYLYQVSTRRTAFGKPFVWWIRDRLDLDAMGEAAALIPGRRDFAAFADRRNKSDSTVVELDSIAVDTSGDLILIRISASHFLWKMVRKLVAALVETGRGTMKPHELSARFAPGAPRFEPSAPPSGLFLEAVTYAGESFDRPLQPIVPVTSHRRQEVRR